MVPRRIMNKTGDNLDLNLAKPYATTEEENTVPIVAKNVTTAEFWKNIPKSAASDSPAAMTAAFYRYRMFL